MANSEIKIALDFTCTFTIFCNCGFMAFLSILNFFTFIDECWISYEIFYIFVNFLGTAGAFHTPFGLIWIGCNFLRICGTTLGPTFPFATVAKRIFLDNHQTEYGELIMTTISSVIYIVAFTGIIILRTDPPVYVENMDLPHANDDLPPVYEDQPPAYEYLPPVYEDQPPSEQDLPLVQNDLLPTHLDNQARPCDTTIDLPMSGSTSTGL
jgi:hypothetical protein